MISVGGWAVPAHYGDAEAELARARRRAAVLDVSCVARIRIRGGGALDVLEEVCTADAAKQEDNTAVGTLLRSESGRAQDDGLLVRLEGFWVLTCDPHRREAVLGRLQSVAERLGAKVDDQTLKTTMFQVVGPGAPEILDRLLPERVSALPAGAARLGAYMMARYIVTRTGAGPSWSLEVTVPNMLAGLAWDFITRKAGTDAIAPAGWLAREALLAQAPAG